jgi:hypothetical protein
VLRKLLLSSHFKTLVRLINIVSYEIIQSTIIIYQKVSYGTNILGMKCAFCFPLQL